MKWAVAAGIVLLVFVVWMRAYSQPAGPEPCMGAEDREKLRSIMLDAIDEAFKNQIIHLFEIWMKDDKDQPNRASTGARRAVRAHVQARNSTLAWNPPSCR